MSGVPIVVGVTGHRDLRTEDIPELRHLVRHQLTVWMAMCPHSEFFFMTSIAEGADQLCGEIALELGMKLLIPLPMEQSEYEKDFHDTSLGVFRSLQGKAFSTFVVPDIEMQNDGSRNYGYRQAGIYVARHCHVLLALWDGQQGAEGCCGTAETVDFKLKKTYKTPDSLLASPDEGIVFHIVTPRKSSAVIPGNALSARLIEKSSGVLDELLKKTDAFNKDAKNVLHITSAGIFAADIVTQLGLAAESLHHTYQLADRLALKFRDKYLTALKCLSTAGAVLVAAFLFYDELEANLFLIVYGLMAFIALTLFLTERYRQCHRKYIEYRLFAETLRVQLNFLASGLNDNAEDLMPWSQRTISPWIREAMNTIPYSIAKPTESTVDVRSVWMQD